MAGIDLEELRGKGVTRASFHPDGSLASVEFGPLASSPEDATQPEQPAAPMKRRSAVGGLVPRGDKPDSQ
jgi:hypothetical protein